MSFPPPPPPPPPPRPPRLPRPPVPPGPPQPPGIGAGGGSGGGWPAHPPRGRPGHQPGGGGQPAAPLGQHHAPAPAPAPPPQPQPYQQTRPMMMSPPPPSPPGPSAANSNMTQQKGQQQQQQQQGQGQGQGQQQHVQLNNQVGGMSISRPPPPPPPPGRPSMPPPPPPAPVAAGQPPQMQQYPRPPPPTRSALASGQQMQYGQGQQMQQRQQRQQQQMRPPPPPLPGQPPPPPPSQQQQQQQQPAPKPVKPHQVERINPSQIPRVPCFTRPDGHPARIYYTKRSVLGDYAAAGVGVGGVGGASGYPANYDGGYGGANPTGWGGITGGSMPSGPVGGKTSRDGNSGGGNETKPPPPSDSRYVVVDDGNASPRLMRSTCFAFPRTKGVVEKVGVPLGLVCTPLGVGSDGFVARVLDGMAPPPSGSSAQSQSTTSTAATGANTDDANSSTNPIDSGTRYETEFEAIPLIKSPYPGGGPVKPHRCPRCQSYLNPFAKNPHLNSGGMLRKSTLSFTCNFCDHHAMVDAVVDVNDPAYSLDLTDAATRYGTVEYELGGNVSPEYVTRDEGSLGPVRQVVLFGIDAAPDEEMGDMVGYYIEAVRKVAVEMGDWWSRQGEEIRRGPAIASLSSSSSANDLNNGSTGGQHQRSDDGQEYNGDDDATNGSAQSVTNNNPRVGFFLYQSDRIVIPHYRKKYESRADHMAPHAQDGISGEVAGVQQRRRSRRGDGGSVMELTVAVMADVTGDPFSPLPCHDFTYDITDPKSLERLCGVLDTVPDIIKDCFDDDSRKQQHERGRSCGGAALAVLSSALSSTGGRGMLLTSHRPNYGAGALRDREAGGTARHYQRIEAERELYTPLQHLVKREISFASGNNNGGGGKGSGGSGGGSKASTANFYSNLGSASATDRVVLDILVTTPLVEHGMVGAAGTGMPRSRFLDVATLSELCRHTCGKFRWVKFDSDDRHGYAHTLSEEILRSTTSFFGNDAVLKVRCSSGVDVESYLPILQQPGVLVDDSVLSSPELEMSTVSPDTCVAIHLRHKIGGIPKESGAASGRDPMVYFQSALLYTTAAGSRRVRVTTLALRSTSVPSEVFRQADFGAVTAFITRQAISDMLRPEGGTHKVARAAIVTRCVKLLANYRQYTSARTSPSGQLILPEALQLLPLFCLSLRKSSILRPSLPKGAWSAKPSPTADERAYHIHHGSSVSPSLAMLAVHSNLYDVTKLRKRDGEWIVPTPRPSSASASGGADQASIVSSSCRPYIQLPKSAHPSITSIDDDGIYMLDDGFVLYLYVGKTVPQDVRDEIFSFDGSSQTPVISSTSDNGRKIRNIAWQMRSFCSMGGAGAPLLRPTTAPIVVVLARSGDEGEHGSKHKFLEDRLVTLLVDDTTPHETFYSDFLCQLHRKIQAFMDNE